MLFLGILSKKSFNFQSVHPLIDLFLSWADK